MTGTIALVRAALAVAASAAVASGCDTSQVAANPGTTTARDSADQVLYGGRTVLAHNGLRRGDLIGDTVLVFDAATRFEFRKVRGDFITSLGRPLSTLTAPSGTLRIASSVVDTHGAAAIVSDTTKRRLDGVDIRFDITKNQFSSDTVFTATSGARKLSGVGFTADPGLFTVKCQRQCTGSLGQ
jgi:hypothetical protein